MNQDRRLFGRTGWRLWIGVFACLWAALAAPSETRAQDLVVEGLRIGAHSDKTRLVVDVNEATDFEAFRLTGPERLVLDMPLVRFDARRISPRGLITGARFGAIGAGRSRIVLDVAQSFHIRTFFTLPPEGGTRTHRIVVDIAPGPGGVQAARPAAPRPPPEPAAAPATAAPERPDPVDLVALRAPDPVDTPIPSAILQPRPRPERTEASLRAPSLPPSGERRTIVLDPGHGGRDPGASTAEQIHEKNIVLAMGRELRELLLATGRYDVRMTRDDDVFITLPGRIEYAHEARGDLFISIHGDAFTNTTWRGASVYTLSEDASDAAAAALAAKENRSGILFSTDLGEYSSDVASILLDLSRRSASNSSIEFAELLVEELSEVTRMLSNARRFANFAVLKSPEIPSILLEMGYLSNPKDALALQDPAHRDTLARAVLRAIDRFFATRPE